MTFARGRGKQTDASAHKLPGAIRIESQKFGQYGSLIELFVSAAGLCVLADLNICLGVPLYQHVPRRAHAGRSLTRPE